MLTGPHHSAILIFSLFLFMEVFYVKKFFTTLMVLFAAAALFAGGSRQAAKGGEKSIEKLSVAFVPSREPQEIVTVTEPLKELLKTEMAKHGYDIKQVEITVGTTYEAVGEALSAGTVDIGLIPGGTYVLYDDGAEVILTATRDGLSIDSDSAKDWNDAKPTTASEKQVTYYRALIITGPSVNGKKVSDKVNAGQALSWDDLNSLNWSVMSPSSPAGYIYPTIWLQDKYQKTIGDLSHVVQSDSYGSAFARLAAGQVDALVTYADARRDYIDRWTSEYKRGASIWDETSVIGVTPGIYNDTICVSKTSAKMNEALKEAIQTSFIDIGNTPEGKKVIAIYTHNGYQKAGSSDYDNERKAQEIIRNLKR
jgi:phosphonate transport system substrate-binding protein